MVVHSITIGHIFKQLVRLWYTAGLKEALVNTDGCTTTVTHHFKVKYLKKAVVENPKNTKGSSGGESAFTKIYTICFLSITALDTGNYNPQTAINQFTFQLLTIFLKNRYSFPHYYIQI